MHKAQLGGTIVALSLSTKYIIQGLHKVLIPYQYPANQFHFVQFRVSDHSVASITVLCSVSYLKLGHSGKSKSELQYRSTSGMMLIRDRILAVIFLVLSSAGSNM